MSVDPSPILVITYTHKHTLLQAYLGLPILVQWSAFTLPQEVTTSSFQHMRVYLSDTRAPALSRACFEVIIYTYAM